MVDTLLVNDEFRTLIPPLDPTEYAGLEESILEEGVRDALIVWNGYIVDGHNRYDICTKHGIKDYRVVRKNFPDVEAVKMWIKKNQISRRNIAPYLRGEYYLEVKAWEDRRAQAKVNITTHGNTAPGRASTPFMNSQKVNTTRDLADSLKVSEQTASRIIQIHEKAPEPIKEMARTGELSVNEAYHATKYIEKVEPERQAEVIEAILPTLGKVAPRESKPHVTHNSGNNEWYTPQIYVDAAREVMGSIDVDPASSDIANAIIKAAAYFTIETDGRKATWHGNVWMNPPYAQPIVTEFCDLLVEKYRAGEIRQACVLVNNATETICYQSMLEHCAAVCFIKGRVKFLDADGQEKLTGLQGQTILYFGPRQAEFASRFNVFGRVLYAHC